MTPSTSTPVQDAPVSRAAADAAGAHRRRRVLEAPRRLSFLRQSALDRILGAGLVVTFLWAGVYWALH